MRTHHLLAIALACAAAAPSPAVAAFPGENGRILFDSDREGIDTDIWTMRADGGKLVNLTPDGSNQPGGQGESEYFDAFGNWRPDGRKIVFTSDRPTATNTEGDNELYVMNEDGSHQRQLTFNALSERYPAWSQDGKAIVFARDLDANRTDDRYDVDLFVMDADGSHQRNLTKSPGVNDVDPAWSPNGRQIAFVSDRGGDNEIYTMDARGKHVRQLTSNSRYDAAPDWSPDGKHLAFEAAGDGAPDVYVMRANGGKQSRLTSSPAGDFLPVWSPDGRFIAFTSDRDGNPDVFTMRADGGAQVNRTRSASQEFATDWQPLR